MALLRWRTYPAERPAHQQGIEAIIPGYDGIVPAPPQRVIGRYADLGDDYHEVSWSACGWVTSPDRRSFQWRPLTPGPDSAGGEG